MRHRTSWLISRIALLFLGLTGLVGAGAAIGGIPPQGGFVENRGQYDPPIRYYALAPSASVAFNTDAVVIDCPAAARSMRMGFAGATGPSRIDADGVRDARLHYFLGSDPRRWRSDIRIYDRITYRDVWPGIDLRFSFGSQGLRIDVIGAEPSLARFSYDGMEALMPQPDGSVRLTAPALEITNSPIRDGGSGSILSWRVDGSNPAADPDGQHEQGSTRDNPAALLWSTFIGGGDSDYAHGVTLDRSGNPVVTGYTRSPAFPTTPGAYDRSLAGSYDVFVAKFTSAGSSLVWATLVGGSLEDRAFTVLLDTSQNPVFGGLTYSADFPTTAGAFDRAMDGDRDAFVAKLNSTGSSLLWSTYLGGSGSDRMWDLALDAAGRPVVVGESYSMDFPTTAGALQTTSPRVPNGFVTNLDCCGTSLVFSTYLGGSADDQTTRVGIGPGGRIVTTGNTSSTDFPTTAGAFDTTPNGGEDWFVSVLDPTGRSLLSSTYIGGAGADMGNALAISPTGDVIAAGSSGSVDMPTNAGAYDTSLNGGLDAFVCHLNADCTHLIWGTFIGGSGGDECFGIALDSSGCPLLTGQVASSNYPTTADAYDRSWNGDYDVFLSKLSADGSTLRWSSFIGGALGDGGWEVTLNNRGDPIIVGPTHSSDFPVTQGSYDPTYAGGNDVFVLQLYGIGTPLSSADTNASFPIRLSALPNPFTSSVTLTLDLPRPASMRAEVVDPSGRRVMDLRKGRFQAGPQRIHWDGRDSRGHPVPPGVYWIRCEADGAVTHEKLIRLR